MNARAPANVPTPLSRARRQLDQWRSRQSGRKRLPRELWSTAVALAREHGINKTARTLGLKYDSLKKHLEATPPAASGRGKVEPEFIELLPREMMPSSIKCTIELENASGGKMRMDVKGASMADLASFARGFRDGRA
jgi:signal recognition particle subunit SEC65